MSFINFAIKSAFVTGAITTGAFLTGAVIGICINREKLIKKIKQMQLKKNPDASVKKK